MESQINNNYLTGVSHLLAGEYSLLVGDDISGRIPTLILRKVINSVYRGISLLSIRTIFVKASGYSGGRVSTKIDERNKNTIEGALAAQKHTKALIMTDTISSGSHVQEIGYSLAQRGLGFDIVTVSFRGDYDEIRSWIN